MLRLEPDLFFSETGRQILKMFNLVNIGSLIVQINIPQLLTEWVKQASRQNRRGILIKGRNSVPT